MPSVRDVCGTARGLMAALGDVASPLLDVCDRIAATVGGSPAESLAEPSFALVALSKTGADPVTLGRVLDLLGKVASVPVGRGSGDRTVAEAVAEFRENRHYTRKKADTRRHYERWLRRLLADHADVSVSAFTTAMLEAFLDRHTTTTGPSDRRGGVAALSVFWRFLDDAEYARHRVAGDVSWPTYEPEAGFAWTWAEQACVRQVALVTEPDPEAALAALWLQEFLFQRACEVVAVRNCDLRLTMADEAMAHFWGKHDAWRREPVVEPLAEFCRWFMEDRRPPHIDRLTWESSDALFLRSRPTAKHPEGVPWGPKGYDRFRTRITKRVPHIIRPGERQLHGLGRKTGGSYIAEHYTESLASVALGHRSPRGEGGVLLSASTPVYTRSRAKRDNMARVREALLDFWTWANTPPVAECGPQGWPLEAKVDAFPIPPVVVQGRLNPAALAPRFARIGAPTPVSPNESPAASTAPEAA